MQALTINNITKSFGHHHVLDDINLSVKSGQLYGLIGLNGIGKTTLIKTALGLMDADAGEIQFNGQPANSITARKQVAFLPEKFTPSPFLKGHEFLQLTLSYYNKPYHHEDAIAILEQLDFDPTKLGKKMTSYSKGMTQKIGLASALLINAPLLILDEPMSGLDPRARIALKKTLKNYCEQGNTVFFSSHILSDIDEICNHIAILHNSRILYNGTPNAFKKKHAGKTLENAFLATIKAAD